MILVRPEEVIVVTSATTLIESPSSHINIMNPTNPQGTGQLPVVPAAPAAAAPAGPEVAPVAAPAAAVAPAPAASAVPAAPAPVASAGVPVLPADPAPPVQPVVPQPPVAPKGNGLLVAAVVILTLVLLGVAAYTVHNKFGGKDEQSEAARLIRELQKQNEESQKEKADLAAELDAEKVAKLAEAKRLLFEVEAAQAKAKNEETVRLEAEADLKKQRETTASQVAAAKAAAQEEINTRLANEESERRKRLQKSKEVVVQDLDPKDFGPITMDDSFSKTHWVPLVKNRSGNLAPFNPADSAPRMLAHRGATWEPIDYIMENGMRVKAWGIRLGKDGKPLGHESAPPKKLVRSGLP